MVSLRRRWTRVGNRLGEWLYRTFDGRLSGQRGDTTVLLLTVPGRRSGVPRSTCLRYLDTPDGMVVWGTGNGAPRDPDWFRNLRAADHAEVQVDDRTLPVRARELSGEERDAVWDGVVVARVPEVQRLAARAGRPIPVAVLVADPEGATST